MAGQKRTSLQWENAKNWENAVQEALETVGASGKEGLRLMTSVASQRAKELVPVDTGRLKASIRSTVAPGPASTMVGLIGSDVHYAPFVEYGTSRMAAQPYLRPAMLEAANWWNRRIGETVHW